MIMLVPTNSGSIKYLFNIIVFVQITLSYALFNVFFIQYSLYLFNLPNACL